MLKGTLVACDYESTDPAYPSCDELRMQKSYDGRLCRLQRGSCRLSSGDQAAYQSVLSAQTRFYRERMVDPYFEPPPDNLYVRKTARNLYPDAIAYHHIFWTLNPRYYPRLFKTKIVWEKCPEGQDEVDDMLSRLHLKLRVIYDP